MQRSDAGGFEQSLPQTAIMLAAWHKRHGPVERCVGVSARFDASHMFLRFIESGASCNAGVGVRFVCVRVRACVRACVRAWLRGCVAAWTRLFVSVCDCLCGCVRYHARLSAGLWIDICNCVCVCVGRRLGNVALACATRLRATRACGHPSLATHAASTDQVAEAAV